VIDRRLNAIGGSSQSALLWVPLVWLRELKLSGGVMKTRNPSALEGKEKIQYIQEEVNEKVYLYSGLKEIHENKLTA
jgi:hypothetical protein